jgi:AraC-like DNA-binding protein
MLDQFRLASTFAQSLNDHKVPLAAVLHNAGLPAGLFLQEKVQVNTPQLFAFWRAIGEVSNDPAIGLKLSAEYRLERYNPTSIAAVCSKTFGDAVQRMGRYKQLVCPEQINLRPSRLKAGTSETAVEFVFTNATEVEPDVLVDNCLAWILTIGQRGTDRRIAPLRVELTRPSKHREILEKYYGCRVKFKAERNAIVFATTDLDMPFTTHNAELLAMVSGLLDAELAERKAGTDVGNQVKHALKRSLAGKRPTLQDVASEVGMSTRSLQRKLSDAGFTFQHVVEETRRELAHHYLSQSAVELTETAYLLGYSDASSFFRAFNSWEGVTPGEWRAKQRAVA